MSDMGATAGGAAVDLDGDANRVVNSGNTWHWTGTGLVGQGSNDILAACRRFGGETVSVVACSQPNRLPTNLADRLVSTFALERWDDLA